RCERAVLDAGQILQTRQPEELEELLRGAVEHRASELLGPARDGDEPPLDQGAQHLAARDAADGFEGGAGHGLAIGNDRERLERRAAELLALARLVEPRERVRATRERHDAHAARDLLDAEGA